MPGTDALDHLRKLRQQQSQQPPDVGAAMKRLGSLASGGGPLTDADLLNARQYEGEPIVDVRKRLTGVPRPATFRKDVNLPVEPKPSGAMGILRWLRDTIGI